MTCCFLTAARVILVILCLNCVDSTSGHRSYFAAAVLEECLAVACLCAFISVRQLQQQPLALAWRDRFHISVVFKIPFTCQSIFELILVISGVDLVATNRSKRRSSSSESRTLVSTSKRPVPGLSKSRLIMLQTLSPREETAVHKLMQKRAATQCEPLILDFVKCSKDRTVSMAWACTAQKRAMVECMHHLTREDHLEEARNIYMIERRRKREETLAQRQE